MRLMRQAFLVSGFSMASTTSLGRRRRSTRTGREDLGPGDEGSTAQPPRRFMWMPEAQFWNGVMVTPRGAPLAPYAPALGRGCHVGTSLGSSGRRRGRVLPLGPAAPGSDSPHRGYDPQGDWWGDLALGAAEAMRVQRGEAGRRSCVTLSLCWGFPWEARLLLGGEGGARGWGAKTWGAETRGAQLSSRCSD